MWLVLAHPQQFWPVCLHAHSLVGSQESDCLQIDELGPRVSFANARDRENIINTQWQRTHFELDKQLAPAVICSWKL